MGFLSPLLLAGMALVAVPIALHLIMRRQARQLSFPALRFVQQRRESNRRKMRLRHWLLLALRCALVAGIAFALARPTLRGTGRHGKDGAPLAVAVVVDNSLRMQYVHQNRSRLEQAADAAQEIVAKLPEDSLAAVCDLGRSASGFAPDLSAASARLRNLRATADARALAAVVVEAIELVADQPDRRQEVFVFTDMTRAAWPDDAAAAVEAALAAAPEVRLSLFDVGVAEPKNAALGELHVRRSVLRPGEPLHIEAAVASNLARAGSLVELSLAGDDGRLEKRRQDLLEFDAQGQARVKFEIADLPLGTHQGTVQLAAADPLAVDNTRYFTVEVRPPARVLLLAERVDDARLLREALSPSAGGAASRFECQTLPLAKAADAPLEDYQAVLLVDPGVLGEPWWKRLDEYVAGGGGVGIFLGHNADFAELNGEAAQRLLPGKLERISREETYLRPQRLDHPALAGLRDYAEDIPWPVCKVFRFWQFAPRGSDSYVVATLANDEPAVLERTVSRGRVLVTTTPLSDPLSPEGREPWNVLPAEPWPYVAVCDQIVGYLAQDAEQRLDYLAGETARLRLNPREQVRNFALRTPDGQASFRVAGGEEELAVGATDQLGNYRLTAGGRSATLDRGFSVNAAPSVSQLDRADPAALAAALAANLPPERVTLEADLAEAAESVAAGRAGRELYPWMISVVAMIWGFEHVLANRFYRQPKRETESND
jgi:hypothetical protein